MIETDKDTYFVAVKLLLRQGDQLLITHDIFGSWDLPGGRLKPDEFNKPLPDVVKRKMDEELGSAVGYTLGEPIVFFRVEREERGQKVRIFAIGYEATYEGGKIDLGKNHDQMKWVDVNSFKPEEFFKGGWLLGVQEYLEKIRA